jgi:hypothetical protein
LVAVIAALVAVAVWVGMRLSSSESDGARPSAYSAVMLANGDVYFGKFTRFPSPRITNAWILQRSLDEKNQVQLGVVPASRAFWSPVDEVNLNSDQIVSWARLRKDSQLVQALENPNSLRQLQGTAPGGSAAGIFEGQAGGPPAGR